MQKACAIRIYIITGGHTVILLCTQINIVSIMDNTLWRLFCIPKEATTGYVTGVCSSVLSEFTY